MIINSDLSIITTPVQSPQTNASKPINSGENSTLNGETPSSETSASDVVEKNSRHRMKARSDSNRSQKYENEFFLSSVFFIVN